MEDNALAIPHTLSCSWYFPIERTLFWIRVYSLRKQVSWVVPFETLSAQAILLRFPFSQGIGNTRPSQKPERRLPLTQPHSFNTNVYWVLYHGPGTTQCSGHTVRIQTHRACPFPKFFLVMYSYSEHSRLKALLSTSSVQTRLLPVSCHHSFIRYIMVEW